MTISEIKKEHWKALLTSVSALIALTMLFGAASSIVLDTESVSAASGNDGDIHWDITGDTLTISKKGGDGEMDNYNAKSNVAPWIKNSDMSDVKNIIVESGVTTIGNFAFFAAGYDLSYETVTIPDTVEYIGEDAFYSSKDLKSVEIPGSVKKIGIEAFSNSGIQALTLNEGNEKIMDRAFEYCINLKELVVPSTVNYTGLAAFDDDSAIKSIEFKGSMIGDRVFAGCNGVITYTFGDNLSSVHNDAFRSPMEDCYFIKDNVSYGNPSADVLKGTTWTSNDGKTFYCSNTAGDMSDAEKYSVPISLGICALIPLFMLGGYMLRKF